MAEHELQKLRPIHDMLIDLVIAAPKSTYASLAAQLGYTATGIGIIMRSDVFREKLASRRTEIIDPLIAASFEDKMNALAEASMERLMMRVEAGVVKDQDMISLVDISAKAKGYGARAPQTVQFVAVMPSQIPNPSDWAKKYGAGAIDIEAVETLPAAGSAGKDRIDRIESAGAVGSKDTETPSRDTVVAEAGSVAAKTHAPALGPESSTNAS